MKTHEFISALGESTASKQDANKIVKIAERATKESPMTLFVGSCPDYEHNGEEYTFGSVNGGVPLLTFKQLSANRPLFNCLELFWHTI